MTSPGAMLRLARQRRGVQQKDAAPILGVSATDLSRIENGLKEPPTSVLNSASAAFRVPVDFFFLKEPIYGAPVSVHPMWRKKAEVTAGEMDSVVAELNVRVMHIRKLLEATSLNPARALPSLDLEEYGDPERVAGLLRAHWQLPAGPIQDLTSVVEEAGVLVAHSPMGGSSISGVTFKVPGMPPLVVLNNDQPADRMRFTLAHELGHLVMHRFPTPNMESEANSFASYFLAPSRDIRPYFAGRRVDLARLAALKPEWKMSMASLVFVAERLGLLTANQKNYIWKQFSMNRYKLREPPELDFPQEKPTILPSLIRLHIESLGYSIADLAKLLCMAEEEFPSFYEVTLPSAPQGFGLRLVK